jgi:hypothetical protein
MVEKVEEIYFISSIVCGLTTARTIHKSSNLNFRRPLIFWQWLNIDTELNVASSSL